MGFYVDTKHDYLYRADYERKQRAKAYEAERNRQRAAEEMKIWRAEQEKRRLEELELKEQKEKEGNKTMKHDNFKSIFTALKEIYIESAERSKEIYATWDQAQDKWNHRPGTDEEGFIIQKGIYLQAKKKFEADMEALKIDTREQTKALYKQLEEGVSSFYAMKPGKVDSATLELLKLGVMKDDDLLRLANDNMGNMTMLSVIGKFAGESDSIEAQGLAHRIKGITNNQKELKGFKDVCEYGDKCFSDNAADREVFNRVFDEIAGSAIENASEFTFDE